MASEAAQQNPLDRLPPVLQRILAGRARRANDDMLQVIRELGLWKYPVESIVNFIEQPLFLNLRGQVWTAIMDILVEAVEGDFVEIVLTGSIGWGKSFCSDILLAYTLYELTCLRQPAQAFGLAEGTGTSIILQSLTEKLAKRVLFSPLAHLVRSSPWFSQTIGYDKRLRSEFVFPGPIRVRPVAGTEQAAIGENVIAAVLDECNYMALVEKSKKSRGIGTYDIAVQNYLALARRMKSRYLLHGKLPTRLLIVSSSRYPEDFTEKKIAEAADPTSLIYVARRAQWETRPRTNFLGPTFRLALGSTLTRTHVLDDEQPAPPDQEILAVPVEYRRDFEQDPDGAVRDIAGRPTLVIAPFLARRETVQAAVVSDWKHPFSREVTTLRDGLTIFPRHLHGGDMPRAIHLDLAVSGDAAGVCMTYCDRVLRRIVRTPLALAQAEAAGREVAVEETRQGREYVEWLPQFHIEAALRIVAPPGGEIQLSEIVELVLQLRRYVPVKFVTTDQFQSVAPRQALREAGLIVGEISVDRTPHAYQDLKTALYDGRLKTYLYKPLLSEWVNLERDERTGKIDHPNWMRDLDGQRVKGSKDVSDGSAGSIHLLSKRRDCWPGEKPVTPLTLDEGFRVREGGIGEAVVVPLRD